MQLEVVRLYTIRKTFDIKQRLLLIKRKKLFNFSVTIKNGQQNKNGEKFMAQDFQANSLHIIEAQLRENYGKIVYSHKTQEKCADILTYQHKLIKNIQVI